MANADLAKIIRAHAVIIAIERRMYAQSVDAAIFSAEVCIGTLNRGAYTSSLNAGISGAWIVVIANNQIDSSRSGSRAAISGCSGYGINSR